MWFFGKHGSKNARKSTAVKTTVNSREQSDDENWIADLKHSVHGDWHQYDILIAARGYDWNYAVSAAEYLIHSDLTNIGTLTISDIENSSQELISNFDASGGNLRNLPQLEQEQASLGVGGFSRQLKAPIKVIWFNQTHFIRCLSPVIDDEERIRPYVAAMIERRLGDK
ncbi:hypothetical protein FC50_GL001863 [Lacticaseibacillus pantheris DSM 15945 = JCM 12539 = NBRC 106106]|uniref:Uncharacterized protein n=1 Tax=Lacticaseibacillus pantheris DSM 15945 = JCM 12539 = NBRC 106106 TaxID=1423783 RepID=A0A0R1TV49_9LACO|nr:hypothetical protein [Lacticaseibacillus pantheris]KRL85069.1 hypothetical protein FC50_GL001863 [Lacticaseibacillus pantheris DSM 15945 = JCM 12539 = NBRC 106106]